MIFNIYALLLTYENACTKYTIILKNFKNYITSRKCKYKDSMKCINKILYKNVPFQVTMKIKTNMLKVDDPLVSTFFH